MASSLYPAPSPSSGNFVHAVTRQVVVSALLALIIGPCSQEVVFVAVDHQVTEGE